MKGIVIWRGPAAYFEPTRTYRCVLISGSRSPSVVVEELERDAAEGERWLQSDSTVRGIVMEQAINDLVATLQQHAQAAQQQQQNAVKQEKKR